MRFTIPLQPVTKKNSQRIVTGRNGRPFILPSKAFTEYERNAAIFVPKCQLDGKFEVTAVFYMPTHRRVDLTNLLEALDDVLVSTGLLRDDCADVIASHDGSRVRYDKDNPRTEVDIHALGV